MSSVGELNWTLTAQGFLDPPVALGQRASPMTTRHAIAQSLSLSLSLFPILLRNNLEIGSLLQLRCFRVANGVRAHRTSDAVDQGAS